MWRAACVTGHTDLKSHPCQQCGSAMVELVQKASMGYWGGSPPVELLSSAGHDRNVALNHNKKIT